MRHRQALVFAHRRLSRLHQAPLQRVFPKRQERLGRIAVVDWLTGLIGLIGITSLAILFTWKVSNPLLIAVAAAVGLVAFPILHPAWVMVR